MFLHPKSPAGESSRTGEKGGRNSIILTSLTTIFGVIGLVVLVFVISVILTYTIQGGAAISLARSVSALATGLDQVCKNDRNLIQLELTIPKEKSIYILNCEQVGNLATIPQYSAWWSDKVRQKEVSWYKGWSDILLDCSKVASGSEKKRIHVALFEIEYVHAGKGNTIIIPKVSSAKVNCALHDMELMEGEGEFVGGTKRKVEIGITPVGTVYARSGGEIQIA